MKKLLLTAVLVVIGFCVYAQERIAVFPFEILDRAVTRNESFQLYRAFSNEFRNRSASGSTVVPRQDVDRLISTEMDFQLTDFSAQEKTAEMMRVQNATQILSGTIGKMGNSITIIVSLYTYPGLDQLPGGASLRANTAVELFDKLPELVQQMQDIIADGNQPIPEGLKYEIVDGKAFTITGYTGNAATVNIPSRIAGFPVTSIGVSAFSECNSLTSITIPSSVTSIGDNAFYGCSSLTSVTIDNSNSVYASIDGVLFDKNIQTLIKYPPSRNQRTYVIPSSVTSIGSHAFHGCSNLTSITIPSSVMSIGNRAFSECNSLISITIPSSVTSIGYWAFSYCRSLTGVTIPSSVTSIGSHAFVDCRSLTSVIIPSSVTSIEFQTFFGCNNLTSVTLSRRTRVVEGAFPQNAKLTYRD